MNIFTPHGDTAELQGEDHNFAMQLAAHYATAPRTKTGFVLIVEIPDNKDLYNYVKNEAEKTGDFSSAFTFEGKFYIDYNVEPKAFNPEKCQVKLNYWTFYSEEQNQAA